MIKQLPCPYCKASWLFVSEYDYGSDYENLGYQGTCKCGKFSKRVTWNKTKEQAIEEWNYCIDARIEELEEELNKLKAVRNEKDTNTI